MTISEMVEKMINDILEKQNGSAELQRKKLASLCGCVPSQINYVIASRFTPEQGYLVESRRGGGGYIRITRVHTTGSSAVMHLVNCIGRQLDAQSARMIISNLAAQHVISTGSAALMLSAVSENALRECPNGQRDALRASILKQMLLVIS